MLSCDCQKDKRVHYPKPSMCDSLAHVLSKGHVMDVKYRKRIVLLRGSEAPFAETVVNLSYADEGIFKEPRWYLDRDPSLTPEGVIAVRVERVTEMKLCIPSMSRNFVTTVLPEPSRVSPTFFIDGTLCRNGARPTTVRDRYGNEHKYDPKKMRVV